MSTEATTNDGQNDSEDTQQGEQAVQQPITVNTSLFYCFDFLSGKRSKIHMIEDDTIVTSIGPALLFFNLTDKTHRWIESEEQQDSGAIAVCVCVFERCVSVCCYRATEHYYCLIEEDECLNSSSLPFHHSLSTGPSHQTIHYSGTRGQGAKCAHLPVSRSPNL